METVERMIKQKKPLTIADRPDVVVNKNMPDYSKDPFIQKKVKSAKKFLQKHGAPGK